MSNEEFSTGFDTLANSYATTTEFGTQEERDVRFNEHEKSVFLTQAQDDLVIALYSGRNPFGAGFEETEELRRYLSNLVEEDTLNPIINSGGLPLGGDSNHFFFSFKNRNLGKFVCLSSDYKIREFPINYFSFTRDGEAVTLNAGTYEVTSNTTISVNSATYTVSPVLPFANGTLTKTAVEQVDISQIESKNDVMFIIFEEVKLSTNEEKNGCKASTADKSSTIEVYPVRHDEYNKLRKNPFRGVNSRRALRLDLADGVIEIICKYDVASYHARYLRRPVPIVLANLDDASVDGKATVSGCELPESLHQRILERAVEKAIRSRRVSVPQQES